MAGISEIDALQAKKRALITESEVYRETLKADLRNLALYGAGWRNRIELARRFGPWLLLSLPAAGPIISALWRKDRKPNHSAPHSGLKQGLAAGLMAFRLYRKYAPMLGSFLSHVKSLRRERLEERRRGQSA